ncbi:hypothetical protein CDIK_2325 [Cucumispora dikerogammari]|nr:hypothetical protein CDIK_2325 [Cucumispora dikerogammari]
MFISAINLFKSTSDIEENTEDIISTVIKEKVFTPNKNITEHAEKLSNYKNFPPADEKNTIAKVMVEIMQCTEIFYNELNTVFTYKILESEHHTRLNKLIKKLIVLGTRYLSNIEQTVYKNEVSGLVEYLKNTEVSYYDIIYQPFKVCEVLVRNWLSQIIIERLSPCSTTQKNIVGRLVEEFRMAVIRSLWNAHKY